MTTNVMTVLGPVSSEELGITSSHDHLTTGMPGWEFDGLYEYNDEEKEKAKEKCISEVAEAKKRGLNTIFEATTSDLFREFDIFKAVQKSTGVNIIASTGIYTKAAGNTSYWNFLVNSRGVDEGAKRLAALYIREITEGVAGTDVKCGIIKVATGNGTIEPVEKAAIKAAAMAQKETGVPIFSHTEAATMGPELADGLIENGADPSKIMIGHCCDTNDLDYVEEILKRDVYVGMDRFGLDAIFPDEEKNKNLIKLLEKGYGQKILVGHDYTVWNPACPLMPDVEMPHFNLCGLFDYFIPLWKEMGVSDGEIDDLLINNPKRFFEGA